jgi:hypothetical protein
LIDLEGAIKMYDANDEGDMKLLGKMQVPKTLCLKKSCPVMYTDKNSFLTSVTIFSNFTVTAFSFNSNTFPCMPFTRLLL